MWVKVNEENIGSIVRLLKVEFLNMKLVFSWNVLN